MCVSLLPYKYEVKELYNAYQFMSMWNLLEHCINQVISFSVIFHLFRHLEKALKGF